MNRRALLLSWAVLTDCAEGDLEEGLATPEPAPLSAVRLSVEAVEGEAVAIPVRYRVLDNEATEPVSIVLEASYRTASPEDIALMPRTTVWPEEGVRTVDFGLLTLTDRFVESTESLMLRPVLQDGPTERIELQEAEIEVVIADGPPPCSGVEVRVGLPRVLAEVRPEFQGDNRAMVVYAAEILVDLPMIGETVEWIAPPDRPPAFNGTYPAGWPRTRTFTDWKVERLGGRVRHHMTAQWSRRTDFDDAVPPFLDLQVCGGAGYGKFVRCSPTECAVHDEGF